MQLAHLTLAPNAINVSISTCSDNDEQDNVLTLSVQHFSDCGKMGLRNRSGPYWSNPQFFLIFDIRAVKNLKNGGLDQYGAGCFEV